MLERAFRLTIANLSTLFLVVMVVVLPLHLAHSYWFKEVIEVAELHGQIASFPADRTVRDVGAGDLRDYLASLTVLALVELGLCLLLVRATRRVIEDDEAGRVPTATRAWLTGLALGGPYLRSLTRDLGPLLVAGLVAAAVGILAERIGLLVIQPLGDQRAWVGIAVVQATSRALAAPFFLVPWACSTARGARPAKDKDGDVPKLY